MKHRDMIRRLALVCAALAVSACVDAPNPSGPSGTDDPLAQTFDALARESTASGDVARGDGFSHAALSVRSGVTPTRIEVRNGTVNEAFDAFVTSVDFDLTIPAPTRPPARRSLVAWRRAIDGTLRVLSLSTPTDSSGVLNPLSLGASLSAVVFTGGSAMYHEGIALTQNLPDLSATWFGTAGWVKIKESSSMGACPARPDRTSAPGGVRCEAARFAVRFDVTFLRIMLRPGGAVAASPPVPPRNISARSELQVNGLRLKFACAMPSSATGCT